MLDKKYRITRPKSDYYRFSGTGVELDTRIRIDWISKNGSNVTQKHITVKTEEEVRLVSIILDSLDFILVVVFV